MRSLPPVLLLVCTMLFAGPTAYAEGGGGRPVRPSPIQRIAKAYETFKAGMRRLLRVESKRTGTSEQTCGLGCARQEGAPVAPRGRPGSVQPARPEGRDMPGAVAPRAPAASTTGPEARMGSGPRPAAFEPVPHAVPRSQPAPPRSRPSESAIPDRYRPYEVRTGRAKDPPTIIFLHGAGQQPDNGVLARLAEGMRSERASARFVSLAHEFDRSAVEKFLATHEGPVVIAGHSAGGARAMRYAAQHSERIVGAILVNPAAHVSDAAVPTLLLRGTNDYGGGRAEGGRNVTNYPVQGGDHSLRFRRRDQHDKAAHEKTRETRAMNRDVARQVRGFLRSLAKQDTSEPTSRP